MEKIKRVIGIDFGTSTTYMNVKNYSVTKTKNKTEENEPLGGKTTYMPVEFNYGESNGFVLSIVRENSDGSFDFGEKASEDIGGAVIHREIKMMLESPDEQIRENARRITKEFFKYLYETYKQQEVSFGSCDEEKTLISYPVKWKPETALFMIDAAKEAGFVNVYGMDEAEAAMTTMICQNNDRQIYVTSDTPGYVMLIDMGAGTTDLVVCRYRRDTNGKLEITPINSWPRNENEPTFGGREIDEVLEEYVEKYLKSSLNPAYAAMVHNLPGQAKAWKERNVSWSLNNNKIVDTCAYLSVYRSLGILSAEFPSFGKKEFEEMAKDKLNDYSKLIKGCLDDAGSLDPVLRENGLDLILLTGGHSAWYFTSEIIDGTMNGWLEHPALKLVRENPKRICTMPTPQITVSLGLVYSELFLGVPQIEEASIEETKKIEESAKNEQSLAEDSGNELQSKDDTETTDDKKISKKKSYKWDDRFLDIVQDFIEKNPRFHDTNEVNTKPDLLKRMMSSHAIPEKTPVYYMVDTGIIFHGKSGLMLSAKGISNYSLFDMEKCSWKKFLNAEIALSNDEKYHVIPGMSIIDRKYELDHLQVLLQEASENLEKNPNEEKNKSGGSAEVRKDKSKKSVMAVAMSEKNSSCCQIKFIRPYSLQMVMNLFHIKIDHSVSYELKNGSERIIDLSFGDHTVEISVFGQPRKKTFNFTAKGDMTFTCQPSLGQILTLWALPVKVSDSDGVTY